MLGIFPIKDRPLSKNFKKISPQTLEIKSVTLVNIWKTSANKWISITTQITKNPAVVQQDCVPLYGVSLDYLKCTLALPALDNYQR